MKTKAKWVLLVALCVEAILVISGLLPKSHLFLLIAAIEGVMLIFILSILIPALYSAVKRVRIDKEPVARAVQSELKGIVPEPVLQLLKGELGVISSIGRFIMKKPAIPPNAICISYGSDFRKMGCALVVVAFLEIILVDILCSKYLPKFPVLRIIFIALSVYAVIWVIGLVLATKMYPHYISADRAVFRYGSYQSIEIPIGDISDIEIVKVDCKRGKMLFEDGDLLCLNNSMRTNEIVVRFDGLRKPLVNGCPYVHEVAGFACSVDFPSEAKRLLGIAKDRGEKVRTLP